MTDIRKSLTEKAKAMGWKVSAAQADQFQTYMELLLEWNEKMNLTAITQPEEVVEKHFLDSMTLLSWPKLKQGAKVIDVGRESLTIWVFGSQSKNTALIDMLSDFGILEIAKTGTIAIERGRSTIYDTNKLREEYDYGKNVL